MNNFEGSTHVRVLRPWLPETDALIPYLRRIDAAQVYSNYGPLSQEFSARLGEMTQAKGVTLTSNGTAAIEVALRAVAGGKGLCLMPSFTFIASAHAVTNAGMTPFLLDIDERSLTLTPDIARRALLSLPERPGAVLVVSAFGAPPDLGAWEDFRAETGIPVVFDAAAAATAIRGVGVAPVCLSLHATKVLGIGEGGAILTSDEELARRMTAMTGFGFLGRERLSAIRGGNTRLSEYAAAVGLAALDALPTKLQKLRSLALGYRKRLGGHRSRLQDGAGETWQTMTLNVVLPEGEAHETTARLDAARVEWRRWWGLGTHHHPAFAEVPRASLPVTEAIAPRVLGLPFHTELSAAEMDRVAGCLP
ncbi:DegT/DnrJ/EryC1/StrS family aminotransferase [Sabulicella rubraurantiaca]|uniref:DegT/DnrJ/EryC1/StrS family aminotransferase n=1 Tax=Sabulicella rubraurantiaca TaxID=2811429 RepID=UPI001A95FB66|nr:DegT/DnrJ/EryC1/StrS family aminotransferase [Sabulicella rubraurantiaca]